MTRLEELAAAGLAFTTQRKQEYHVEAARVLQALAATLDWPPHAYGISTDLGTAMSPGTTTLHASRLLIKVSSRQRTAAVSISPCESRRDRGVTRQEWIPTPALYDSRQFLGELKAIGMLERSAEIEATPAPKRRHDPDMPGPGMG